MNTIAGWIAPIATMIAAMMTAANLGARVTGWGFVIFVLGSISWSVVGLTSGQANLLATNAFLTVVNVVGVWRWLWRQAKYEDGGKSAERASHRSSAPTLFTATGVTGMSAETPGGAALGKVIEALIECSTGRVSYLVIASGRIGGVDEELRAVPRDRITFHRDRIGVQLGVEQFARLPVLEAGAWPAKPAGL